MREEALRAVNAQAFALPAAVVARDGHVDEGRRVAEAPEGGGREVAQGGPFPARQDRCEPPALLREVFGRDDGVDAAVKTMKCDRSPRDATSARWDDAGIAGVEQR